MTSIFGGPELRVSEPGWMARALTLANGKQAFVCVIDGDELAHLVAAAKASSDLVTKNPLVGLLAKLPIPPALAQALPASAPVLGGLVTTGFVIGMEGAIGVVEGIAHANGMTLGIALVVPPDVTKTQLQVGAVP